MIQNTLPPFWIMIEFDMVKMGRTEKNGSHVTKKKLTTYTITTALFGKPLGLNNETYPEIATDQVAQNSENS